MSNTIANVSITQVAPLDPLIATVSVAFDIGGPIDPESVVQIYASPRSQSISNLVETVELVQNQHVGYRKNITLQAGVAYFIYFCPRADPNNPDEKIDGMSWEGFCVFFPFTTQMSSAPPPRPPALPLPTIDASTTRQATLNTDGRIDIHWVSAKEYDAFGVVWFDLTSPSKGQRGSVESSGRDGSFGISPALPGHRYQFEVGGIVEHKVLGVELSEETSEASDPFIVVMPPNTRSLRTFLRLSNVTLSPGLRSLGVGVISRGLRAMMKL